MSKEELVELLSNLLDDLNWKRVGLLLLFGAFLIALIVLFEGRNTVVDKLYKPSMPAEVGLASWVISDITKTELTNLVNSQELLGGAVVMEVNLKKNLRNVKFWMSKQLDIRDEAAKIVATLLPQPLFSDNPKNNDQMQRMLNNEFVCVPTVDTMNVQYFSNIQGKYPYLCRLAVPPIPGEFAGFVSIFLTRTPTIGEIEALKIEMTRLSINIYVRDVGASK